MAARKEIPRELSIYINDKAVVNSMRGITSEITRTNNEMKNLNRNSATYDEDLKKLKGNLSELQAKQSAFKDEIYATDKATKDASGSMSKLYNGLISGDLETAKEGLTGIKAEMTGLVKTSLAFIATPIGAAIAVFAGFAAGAKAIFDFNQNAEKSAVLIENLSGKTGQVVEDIRVKMQALTDTFGLTFDQLAGAVDNLVDTGVAKDELEALEKIKNGLLTAPDKNEFITSLESSAVIAKQVGLTLEEVIALKKEIETTGVDPEATFGALQKASQKLEVQASSLRVTMTNALGAAFTDEVLAKIKTGEITTVQALDLINKKTKEVGLNQTQQAELAKELFGKSALAAGGFSTVLDTVTGGLKKQKEELNGNQKALADLATANENLGKAQSELFRVKDFGELWTGIKAKATDFFASALTYLSEFKSNIQPLIDLVGVVLVQAWIGLKFAVTNAFDFIGGAVKIVTDNIKFSFNIIKAILTGDFTGAIDLVKNYFVNLGATVGNIFGNIKNNIINAIQGVISNVAPLLKAVGLDVDLMQKKLEGLKSKEIPKEAAGKSGDKATNPDKADTKTTEEELAKQKAIRDAARQKEAEARKAAADKKQAEQDKANKIEQDKMLALAKAKEGLAKAELASFIANERSKIDSTKQLTPEIIAEETKRLDDIRFLKENELANERLRKIEAAQADYDSGKINAETLAAMKATIDLEYLTAEQALDLEFQATTDALKKQYIEEQKVLNAEQLAADNELALAEATTKEEEDAINRQIKYDKEKLDYKKLLDDKKITQEEYNRFIVAIDKQKEEDARLAKINSVQGQLQEMGKLADASIAIFGQNKAASTAMALINGGLAVTEILKTPSTFPEPFASISRGIQIAGAIATSIRAIAQINKAKAPSRAKFFYGGATGTTAHLGYDEYGPMTGVVHKNEYVIPETMTQSPRYANTIAWLEQERIGNARKFATGGGTSPGAVPVGIPSAVSDGEMQAVLNAILFRLNNPIAPNLKIGYSEAENIQTLNDERTASAQGGVLNE